MAARSRWRNFTHVPVYPYNVTHYKMINVAYITALAEVEDQGLFKLNLRRGCYAVSIERILSKNIPC